MLAAEPGIVTSTLGRRWTRAAGVIPDSSRVTLSRICGTVPHKGVSNVVELAASLVAQISHVD